MGLIKNSVGLKIFSIVSFIVFLMVGVLVLNVRLVSRVGNALDRVTGRYIEAYGASSSVNVRSLEQALNMRGLVIARFLSKSREGPKELEELIAMDSKYFWEETALIHNLLGAELKEGTALFSIRCYCNCT
jgi:hypothetical protein